MKVSDVVLVLIDGRLVRTTVYGEVYKPIRYTGFYPGQSHLEAIEVYIDGKVTEHKVETVISENR